MRRAVATEPNDPALRLHLAELLISAGGAQEAVPHLAAVLQIEPDNSRAGRLMSQALAPEAPKVDVPPEPDTEFDWSAAARDLGDTIPPKFVSSETETDESDEEPEPIGAVPGASNAVETFEVETAEVTLADVGGLSGVKERLNAAFLAPMRNPKLRKLFGKSLRGGLLLYGPPGCGKTFIAQAVAGELGARFISVTMSDILDMWLGNSEKNVRELFRTARANAPCVLFFDELDAIGQKRSQLRHSGMRGTVNQLLTELDGVAAGNDGVFALAATNHPWDVDSALLRPGRFDRAVAVLPPDTPGREAIFEYHLRDRPVAGIKLGQLAKQTEGFSGADIAHVCETASERALLASVSSGEVRMIEMADLLAARAEVTPSTGAWFTSARNVAMYANPDGMYNDVVAYLKQRRLW
ncbi:MAG TPA: AAA family ATPase [Mycobacteriales bacterium]|jgi:SpoVK/Ycf46/Vps4 family AAA+-type ATPase|nr:AAA family ATPase [Mycobacteriales bacterium]